MWLLLIGLAALSALVAVGDRMPLVRNTSLLVLGTLAISLPIGTVLAFLLTRTDLPGRRVFALILGLLLFVPLYLQAAGWLAGFGIQGWHTLAYGGGPWIEGWRGTIWIHAMAAVPWVTLIVAAGLLFVEPNWRKTALLDTSAAGVLWHVTLPRSAAALGVAALWIAILTAGEMTVTDLFQIRTYAEEIFVQIWTGAGSKSSRSVGRRRCCWSRAWRRRAWRAVPAWPRWCAGPRGAARWCSDCAAWRWPLCGLMSVALLILLGVPLGNLIYKAGLLSTATESGLLRTWSLEKTIRIVATSPWSYADEFRWSLVIGGLAATSAVAVGVLLAWLSRRGGVAALLILALMAACLSLPGPLLGLGLIWALNRPEFPWLADLYDYSILAPCVALTLRALPLTALVLWHALRSVPEETLEAAMLDGAGWWTRLFLIALPQRRSALMLAWLVAFAISLADLAASILVVPPGVMTLPIQIFGKLHYGQEDDVAGICLALIGLFALLAAAAAGLARIALREAASGSG